MAPWQDASRAILAAADRVEQKGDTSLAFPLSGRGEPLDARPPLRLLEREPVPENSLSRRSLAKTAAWSIPVVAVAVATPAAASNATVDIVVSRTCVNLNVLGQLPRFTISAVSGDIPAGTTFTLSGAALAAVTVTSTAAAVGVLVGSNRTITIGAATPSAEVTFSGLIGAFALSRFTLSLASVPAGYTETNAGNNSAYADVTGLSVGPVFVGTCDLL